MNIREYFERELSRFPVPANSDPILDRLHPNADEDTFGSILAEMPMDSGCGADCVQAIDATSALCRNVEMAFGNDMPRLYETTLYTCCRVVSCFIRG